MSEFLSFLDVRRRATLGCFSVFFVEDVAVLVWLRVLDDLGELEGRKPTQSIKCKLQKKIDNALCISFTAGQIWYLAEHNCLITWAYR